MVIGRGCMNCTKRHVGCHSTCETYLNAIKEAEEWEKQVEKGKAKVREFDRYANVRDARFRKMQEERKHK